MSDSIEPKRGFPWWRLIAVAVLLGLDLWTKHAIFAWLDTSPRPEGMVQDTASFRWRYPLAGQWLALMISRNPGSAFGMLSDYPHFLIGGRVIAVIVLSWLTFARRERGVLMVAFVLVLSGALGNLHDNLVLEPPPNHPFGEVRDFIDVYFSHWEYHFPTFNVADSCITCGAVLLLLSGFFGHHEDDEAGAARSEQSAVNE